MVIGELRSHQTSPAVSWERTEGRGEKWTGALGVQDTEGRRERWTGALDVQGAGLSDDWLLLMPYWAIRGDSDRRSGVIHAAELYRFR